MADQTVVNKFKYQQALSELVDEWERLPGGNHRPRDVERWLKDCMAPAIDRARRALGRLRPDGSAP